MSLNLTREREHSGPDAPARLPESAPPEQLQARREDDREEGVEFAHGSISQWENCVANDHARIHNGPVYIRNQYSGRSGEPSQALPATTEHVDFIKALEFDHMDSRYESIDPAHSDTCRWLFRKLEYIQWRDNRCLDSHKGFLWIKGKAGSGKSTLMKCALEHAQSTLADDKVIFFFFNARGRNLEKSIEGMYRSLLSQMIRQFPGLRENYPMYSPETVQQHGWPIAVLRNHFAKAILSLDQGQTVTIYVDALDECDEDEIRAAIDNFEELSSLSMSRHVPIHICFASRHYPRITVNWCVELILEDQDEHRQDIRTYIDRKLPIRDFYLKSSLATQIRIRSSGVFFWVVLVVRIIRKQFDGGASYDKLLRTLREVPDELQALIGAIVQTPDDVFLWAMRWILFARQSLTVSTLYFAIQTSTDQSSSGRYEPSELSHEAMEAFILASSRGLIEKTSDDSVQLVHESVREYLLAGGLPVIGPCSEATVEADIHAKLYTCCHSYLRKARKDIITFMEPEGPGIHNVLDNYPLFGYAASRILQHFRIALSAGMICLCTLHNLPLEPLLYWVQSFDRRCEDKYQRSRQLSEPQHRYSAFLYVAMFLCEEQLMRATLVQDAILLDSHGDGHLSSATMHYCDFVPSHQDINIHLVGNPSSLLAIALDKYRHELEVPILLIDHGADLNADEGHPLNEAVDYCDVGAVKLLLNRGAHAEMNDRASGMTLLTLAVSKRDPTIVALLLEHGALANGSGDASVASPLLAALEPPPSNDLESRPKTILSYHDLIHHHDDSGFRCISRDHNAPSSRRQREWILAALLYHGADIDLRTGPRSISPLQYAIEQYGKEVVRSLLARGQSKEIPSDQLLIYAARALNVEVVEYCLQADLHVGVRLRAIEAALLGEDSNVGHWTVNHKRMSAASARLCIVKMLQDTDISMDMIDSRLKAQVVDAILRRKDWIFSNNEMMGSGAARLLTLERLLELRDDPDLDLKGFQGNCETVLVAAAASGRFYLVKYLLESGADMHCRSSRFGGALDVALLRGHAEIVKLLVVTSTAPPDHSLAHRIFDSPLRTPKRPWLL